MSDDLPTLLGDFRYLIGPTVEARVSWADVLEVG
jgi:hypothetical protein